MLVCESVNILCEFRQHIWSFVFRSFDFCSDGLWWICWISELLMIPISNAFTQTDFHSILLSFMFTRLCFGLLNLNVFYIFFFSIFCFLRAGSCCSFFFIAYTPWVSQKIYDIFKSRMQKCGNCFVGMGDREKVAKNKREKYILPAGQKFRCHQREPSTPAVFLVFCSL